MMEAAKDIIENIEKVTPELHTFDVKKLYNILISTLNDISESSFQAFILTTGKDRISDFLLDWQNAALSECNSFTYKQLFAVIRRLTFPQFAMEINQHFFNKLQDLILDKIENISSTELHELIQLVSNVITNITNKKLNIKFEQNFLDTLCDNDSVHLRKLYKLNDIQVKKDIAILQYKNNNKDVPEEVTDLKFGNLHGYNCDRLVIALQKTSLNDNNNLLHRWEEAISVKLSDTSSKNLIDIINIYWKRQHEGNSFFDRLQRCIFDKLEAFTVIELISLLEGFSKLNNIIVKKQLLAKWQKLLSENTCDRIKITRLNTIYSEDLLKIATALNSLNDSQEVELDKEFLEAFQGAITSTSNFREELSNRSYSPELCKIFKCFENLCSDFPEACYLSVQQSINDFENIC